LRGILHVIDVPMMFDDEILGADDELDETALPLVEDDEELEDEDAVEDEEDAI